MSSQLTWHLTTLHKSCFLIFGISSVFLKIVWMDLLSPINVFQKHLPTQISRSKLVTEFEVASVFFTKADCAFLPTRYLWDCLPNSNFQIYCAPGKKMFLQLCTLLKQKKKLIYRSVTKLESILINKH